MPAIAPNEWKRNATNLLRLVGMGDARGNTYPIDATVTGTVLDASGTTPIAGAVDLVMTHVTGTVGEASEYRALVPASVPLPLGYVLARVHAESGGAERTYERKMLVTA